MYVICICLKFQNDLTVIYGDMGPFILAQLQVPLSVLVSNVLISITFHGGVNGTLILSHANLLLYTSN